MTDHREPSKWRWPSTVAATAERACAEDSKSDKEDEEEKDEKLVDRERALEIPLRSRRARIMLQCKIQ